MSEIDARYVKQGSWINVDRGQPMGTTITTTSQTGAIIVALLAILSSLATTHLWSLIVFANHQFRADGRPADALFRQQQALLRTSPTPTSFLVDWTKLYWIWRKRTHSVLRRSVVQLLVGGSFAVLSIVAGIFSSYVVISSNIPVLVQSSACGPLNVEPTVQNFTSWGYLNDLVTYLDRIDARSVPFAEECFTNANRLPPRCGAFLNPPINLEAQKDICPFDPSICISRPYPAVSIDSGLVDANNVFGLNMQKNDRVKLRRKATCAILKTDGRTTVVNASEYPYNTRKPMPGEQYLQVSYGTSRNGGALANATFSQSSAEGNVSATYGVGFVSSYANKDWTAIDGFIPMPELSRNDADLSLISMSSNQVTFHTPVNDPFFAAHKPYTYQNPSREEEQTLYTADAPFSVMGCRQQYQLCHAQISSSDFCTKLTALPGTINRYLFPSASSIQLAALQLLVSSSFRYNTAAAAGTVVQVRNLAERSLGQIQSLPDDQWVQEVLGWERYIWASKMIMVSDYAVGYGALDAAAQAYVRTNLSEGERELCGSQRMVKSGGFVNISVFGLSFIIAFSCLFTILSLFILKLCIFLSRFRRALAPRIDRWAQDGVFQLQRRAHEANHLGTWALLSSDVPVTVGAEVMPELPLETRCPGCCQIAGVENKVIYGEVQEVEAVAQASASD